MRIAISAGGNSLNDKLQSRFGRADKFLIYDTADESFIIIDNKQNLQAAQGAGIQSAQNIVNSGAHVLISGHCGPKAFSILNSSNIKIFTSAEIAISEAIQLMLDGKLTELQNSDVEGHWV